MAEKLLKFFFMSMCVIAFWFTGTSALLLHKYAKAKSHTEASAVEWEVVEKRSDYYLLKAKYSYVAEEQTYFGSQLFFSPAFRNLYAANEEIKQREGKALRVWYDPLDPTTSSLEHAMPIKQIVYSLILWALALYFWILRRKAKG